MDASRRIGRVAVRKVLVGADESTGPCIRAVGVPSREVAEIHLVAGRDGRYTFEETASFFQSCRVPAASASSPSRPT